MMFQVRETGHVIVVEWRFDVAKLVETSIRNAPCVRIVVAS